MRLSNSHWCICTLLFILLSFCAGIDGGNAKIKALFSFGDSLVDPGNNNFIPTIFKGNHAPYGQDFIANEQNGRFSNGKLATDFIASGLGLKETIPPFLDADLSSQDLLTGVSFASAGSGFDHLTSDLVSAIPMWKQVELFKTYKTRLENMVGVENSSNIIEEAIFLLIAGSNDFMVNYFSIPNRRNQFTVQQYQDFLLQICSNFIQEIYKLGVRKLGVAGLPPLGCVPAEKTLHGQPEIKGCIEELNYISSSYNEKCKKTLSGLQARLPGIRVEYVDIYNYLLDIIDNPSLYGDVYRGEASRGHLSQYNSSSSALNSTGIGDVYRGEASRGHPSQYNSSSSALNSTGIGMEITDRGCCGTGLIEAGPICNAKTPIICRNTSTSVFWDSVHPTEATYKIVADLVLQQNIKKLL